MRRHAFLIILAVVLVLIGITVAVILVVKARYGRFLHDTPAFGTVSDSGLLSTGPSATTAT